MNIGEASKASGVSVKMLRYYESIGLLPRAQRTESGYRVYRAEEVSALRFIRNARDLGFPLSEIEALLGLWRDRGRASAEVKRLALAHVAELDEKASQLRAMSDALRHLADHCQGDERPDCPIIEGLSGQARGAVSPGTGPWRTAIPRKTPGVARGQLAPG